MIALRRRKTTLSDRELAKASNIKVPELTGLYARMDRLITDAMAVYSDGVSLDDAASLIVHLEASARIVRNARRSKILSLTKTKYEFLKEEPDER